MHTKTPYAGWADMAFDSRMGDFVVQPSSVKARD